MTIDGATAFRSSAVHSFNLTPSRKTLPIISVSGLIAGSAVALAFVSATPLHVMKSECQDVWHGDPCDADGQQSPTIGVINRTVNVSEPSRMAIMSPLFTDAVHVDAIRQPMKKDSFTSV
jgi:hypothetical protein